MAKESIHVKGAREHNLKNIDVVIPRDKLVVLTGLSGSGKSSLAFDTIYAEGQRRYVESLSAYARQFLGQMEKPDVDYIEGLSPAISIDQKTTTKNPRSTVGTVTEIYDYLRLLYARIGRPHCIQCGKEISRQSLDQIVDQILSLPAETRLQILAPLVRGRKGEYQKLLEDVKKSGFVRVRVDGAQYELSENIDLDKNKKHQIEVIVDRLILKPEIRKRAADSLETALKLGKGLVIIDLMGQGELIFSENFACPDCGISIEEIEPRLFSFNNPYGACPACTGLGIKMEIDPELVIDKDKSIRTGAILPWSSDPESWSMQIVNAVAGHAGLSLDLPLGKASPEQLRAILFGTEGKKINVTYRTADGKKEWRNEMAFEGIVRNLERRYHETQSEMMRAEIEKYMSIKPCPVCKGARLKPESLAVTVGGAPINNLTDLSVEKALSFLTGLQFTEREKIISTRVLKEIRERLNFLMDVGLNYLTLSRAAGSLSGGEAQRIRLATQIGSGLMGVLYILDEPSIGLHQKDNRKLIQTLKRLRDLGNTLIVVEHDEEIMRQADYLVDIGPGAGAHGGEIVAAGTVADIMACEESLTGQYLRGDKSIPTPAVRRKSNGKHIRIIGAAEHNLKEIDVAFPLGVMVAVTGVSGSGKSTLINEILYPALAQRLHRAGLHAGAYRRIEGVEHLDKVIDIGQDPIGRTPRSNPATYTGVFTDIRDVFARTQESKTRGYGPGRFSFNVKGGRCEACGGDGIIRIEMHFLPDVYVPCEICHGRRYNRETLEIRYKGKNIAEVLEMRVEEALDFFQNIPRIRTKMQTLHDVGLDYIQLGQPATTLSGGEAQRVKLATELSRRSTGRTLYILDEPTTGLHFEDIRKLLLILHRLVDTGNTVVVIEHNLDVIKTVDFIIDLGPEGGDKGGEVIATGTPEEIAANPRSYTGEFLKRMLPGLEQ
ncbi:MAG: excinuclease ABC subunit UvrA [Bacillota bacterium]